MLRSALFNRLRLVPIWILLVVLSPTRMSAGEITWLSKLDSGQRFEAGQVVGLFGSGLSLSTAGADRVLVAAASDDTPGAVTGHAPVSLSGQVELRVFGPVKAGDLVFASGRNDGTAAGLAPSEITPAKLRLLVGRAVGAYPVRAMGTVTALVGLSEWEALVYLLEARDALIEAQEEELATLRLKVAALGELATEVAELRRTTSSLEALEEARRSEELAPLPLDPN